MPIKAEIIITNEEGVVYEGVVELHLKGSGKKKGLSGIMRNSEIRGTRSKIIIRLRQFISEGFLNKSTKRTMSEIIAKFRTKGIKLEFTQLQPYLTQMVVNDELEREQVTRGKKKIFLYYKG